MRRITMLFLVCGHTVWAQTQLIDACEDPGVWTTFQSAGVTASHRGDAGFEGRGVRLDIEFPKGSGYGGLIRQFDHVLTDNFQISFMMRADIPVNNFEVKVSDDSGGANVWWVNTKNYTYPSQWKRVTVKKRHLGFAWGPNPAPHPTRLRRLEIVVTAGQGGKGSVWIDNLQLRDVEPVPANLPPPTASASTFADERQKPARALAGQAGAWTSASDNNEWFEVDLKHPREFGGIRLRWGNDHDRMEYGILGSLDGSRYDTLYNIKNGKGGEVFLFVPESEAQFVRLVLRNNGEGKAFRLEDFAIIVSESLTTQNHYFELLASTAPRGYYPRYFTGEKSYWTVVGIPVDRQEALLNEDGMFETDKQSFSLEPFIRLDQGGALLTWAHGRLEQSLADGFLPLPEVRRIHDALTLSVTLLASGTPGRSAVMARYAVVNTSGTRQRGAMYLAMRPFQVNPPYQWLNVVGGTARVDSITIRGSRAWVGSRTVTVSGTPDWSAAVNIDRGEIVHHIAKGVLPREHHARDQLGFASGAFGFRLDLQPGDSLVVIAAVPFTPEADHWSVRPPTEKEFRLAFDQEASSWKKKLVTVSFNVPPSAQRLVNIIRSTLAYILINMDGYGTQPGSRSYERSWIRDGSMTSASLLKLGVREEVRTYIDWYAPYQYENGMVPCVVDGRGPDPVPENDSHGQLIFAIMEYARFTGDTAFLRSKWPNIVAAVGYIQHLRSQRMTPEYRDGDEERRAYYGLVTESISHEGYSAKPMHSYWDNFFVLKGLKDAAEAAEWIGKKDTARMFDSLARAFRVDLMNSIRLAMRNRNIDFIPGCVELGDFDPTSTSIALFPAGEWNHVPQPAFDRTFERYFSWFQQRSRGEIAWDAYTPYEIRNIGTFIYLGRKDRAHTLLDWFLGHQRPAGWNHWAEVVWSQERRQGFIGDMPHTWVGSDYINAIRAMFVYEDDDRRALVVGAGLKEEWVTSGLSVDGLPTHFGTLNFAVASDEAGKVKVRLSGSVDPSRTPVNVPVNLLDRPLRSAFVNGERIEPEQGFLRVRVFPATLDVHYQ